MSHSIALTVDHSGSVEMRALVAVSDVSVAVIWGVKIPRYLQWFSRTDVVASPSPQP